MLVLQLRVDAQALRLLVGEVAQHALGQREVLVQQAARRLGQRARADRGPGLAQVGDVVGQLGVAGVLGVGAQDEAAAGAAVGRRGQRLHAGAQLLAQLGRADALRDADMAVLRQEDQQPPGDADLRRQPRALGADRVLHDLHGQRLAFEDLALDRQQHAVAIAVALAARAEQVGHVQEGRALETDVDERALHAGQHARDLAEVDVADQAALERALEVQLLQDAALDDRDPRLLRRPVDQDVLHAPHGSRAPLRLRAGSRPRAGGRPRAAAGP